MLTSLLALASLATIAAVDDSPAARGLPGLLLAFVLPGYALSLILLPERRPISERALLVGGLSLAIATLAALLLDQTRWKFTAETWAVVLAGVTVVASGVGVLVNAAYEGRRVEFRPNAKILAFAAAALLVGGAGVGAVALARKPADSRPTDGYTTLWIMPAPGSVGAFRVGVLSQEVGAASYRVVASTGPRRLFQRAIQLSPGQEWRGSGTLALPPGSVPPNVEVRLYKGMTSTTPYRHVLIALPA